MPSQTSNFPERPRHRHRIFPRSPGRRVADLVQEGRLGVRRVRPGRDAAAGRRPVTSPAERAPIPVEPRVKGTPTFQQGEIGVRRFVTAGTADPTLRRAPRKATAAAAVPGAPRSICRSTSHAKPCETAHNHATRSTTGRRNKNRPSRCTLPTGTRLCPLMRRNAKVPPLGLEPRTY